MKNNVLKRTATKLAAACAFCVMLGAPAIALDAEAVLKRFEATLNAEGYTGAEVTRGETKTEGNDIIFENIGITLPELGEIENLTLRLNDVSEGDDGSFTIGKFTADDFSLEKGSERIEVSGLEVEQYHLPAAGISPYGNHYLPHKSSSLKSFALYSGDKLIFSGGNTYGKVTDFEADKRIQYQGSVENFSFDMNEIGGEPAAGMKEMGYETLSGKIEFSAGLNFDTKILDLENFELSFDNIGTLGLKLQVSGYTTEVAQSLAKLQTQDEQAAQLALLGLAQQLNFNSLSLRFEDHSITNKALDYVGKSMGASRQDMVSAAVAGVQFGLAYLQHADFALKVSEAVGSFLNAPESIEVVATPAQPLPFMIIAGSAQDPKSLIDMLGVEVNANK